MSTHLLISDNWLVFALILQSLPDFTHYKKGQNGYDMEIHFRVLFIHFTSPGKF